MTKNESKVSGTAPYQGSIRDFVHLIKVLDSTNKTTKKVNALADYFTNARHSDKVWAIALLSHRRPPRPVNTALLREWAAELANIPRWLFEESYHIVGDLAETIALIVPSEGPENDKSLSHFLEDMIWLKRQPEEIKKAYLLQSWKGLDYYGRFVFTKLITGGFRIGVSQKLMTKALSKSTGIDEDILAYKLMGNWDPQQTTFEQLVLEEHENDALSKPYPFYLAYALEQEPNALGDVSEWSIEHKWDGIRAQIIIRNNEIFIWSRGEELVTEKYPEFEKLIGIVPNGTVLDGELLPYPDGQIGTFNDLQTRIGRKTISKNLLAKTPVVLTAYDLLEWKGKDIRKYSFLERRQLLEEFFKYTIAKSNCAGTLFISERIHCNSWEDVATERQQSREKRSEGLMLKRLASPYKVGRKKGDWWKWKVDPLSIDAVLTYAMRGHGRRSTLFTDYTFALWRKNDAGTRELVTFAKAYSGLTDAEFKEVDAWIKKNTLERFGPVRSVTPFHVFEIAFEGVALSKRHKSGLATRFPRILRWRKDKKIEEANSIEDLKNMLT